jgi:hypothetical protein
VASSVLALARNIAGAFGIAIFGTILNKSIESKILNISHNSVLHVHSAAEYTAAIGLMNLKAQIASYAVVFATAATLMLIGAFTALFIKVTREDMGHAKAVTVE